MNQSQTPTQHPAAANIAGGIRRRVLEHTLAHNGGYLSQACSSAELFATLYSGLMNLGASEAPMIPLPFAGVPGPKKSSGLHGSGLQRPESAGPR